jgi:hypothetical protein
MVCSNWDFMLVLLYFYNLMGSENSDRAQAS